MVQHVGGLDENRFGSEIDNEIGSEIGSETGERMRRHEARSRPAAVVLGAVVIAVLSTGCSADEPAARQPSPAATPASSPASPGAEAVSVTRSSVGHVAGRLGSRERQAVKGEVTALVDRYLDGAFVAGPWPRADFSTAFVDFRPVAAADASGRDLDLVTLHDVGGGLSGVTATKRRLRIDVLAPRGEVSAATAHFELALISTPGAGGAPAPTSVTGSLYLTSNGAAWKVFGYDVRKGTA